MELADSLEHDELSKRTEERLTGSQGPGLFSERVSHSQGSVGLSRP